MNKFEKRILDYLSEPGYVPVKATKLPAKLKLSQQLIPQHDEAISRLIENGKVHLGKKGRLRLASAVDLIAGIMRRVSSGAGYVIPKDRPAPDRSTDIYVASSDVRDAHSGDEVLVRLRKRRRSGGQRCGRVEQIVSRATTTFVGTYFEQDEQGRVRVDGRTFVEPVLVGDPGAKGARTDDKVVIEMLRFPTHYRAGEAVLTKVLGGSGEVGVDTESIIHEFGLPDDFPEKVLDAARKQADKFDEADTAGRRDLTKDVIVTIDPVDARDFDDAISLSRSKDGHWHLGVHIADVSHFVKPGTALDAEAYNRGTSVYLPRRVLPMLPEVISNGLASLQQGKVRYVKSAFIEFTAEGVPVHTELANSAIKVTRRFAYEEVLPVIRSPQQQKGRVGAKVRKLLSHMYELAMILRRRRFEATALELNMPEVKIDFDDDGRVSGAHERINDESHQIIEEFMLAANVAVATELADRNLPYLRRVHADPDEAKLRRFSEFVTALGYPLKKYQSRTDLQALIERVRNEPVTRSINYALLRSMKQAAYSAAEMGHYALAFENYCHFTSPIRRYPDLTIHRLIDRLIKSPRKPKKASELELIKLGKHLSAMERRAAQAERELVKIKLLTYMKDRVGDEMDAFITGVEQFGVFCQCVEIPVEGLIHVSVLEADDRFDYDQTTISFSGRRTGRTYRLGDPIRVVVARVDVDRRELDLRLAPRQPRSGQKRVKRKGTKRNSADRTPPKKSRGKKESTGKKPVKAKRGRKAPPKTQPKHAAKKKRRRKRR